MGIEHSKGSQTLCYINAHQEEECFRNEFEMENVFEMGFDIVQRDNLDAALKYGLDHLEELDPDQRKKIAAFTEALSSSDKSEGGHHYLQTGVPVGHGHHHHPEIVTESQAHHVHPQHHDTHTLQSHNPHPHLHKPLDQHSEEL